jgi:6-phosphogluconolactonase
MGGVACILVERKTIMAKEILAFIGTYTRGKSEGVYTYRLDPATGALSYVSVAKGLVNPSFVAIHPQWHTLYAVNEVSELGGKPGGGVAALRIEANGALTLLSQQSTIGKGPCHVSVDHSGKMVMVANYGSGSVAAYLVQADGSLGEASDFHQHAGSSVDSRRQTGPHAHSIQPDPPNRYALTPDLGMDKVIIYKMDLAAGKLLPNAVPFFTTHPGDGPRHLDFSPDGKYVYIITEMGNSMIACAYNAATGALQELQTLATLPEGYSERSHCADVHVSPNNKFLYGSNRGHDSLAIYAIDQATGKLTTVGHASTQGKTPRNFSLSPDGAFLYAANQDTDNIVAYRVNAQTGQLTPTGRVVEVGAPVCIKMLVR